jgi:hypothetical protein
LPFAGDSPLQIALRHAHDEPPPLPADVPPGVREVVERAMAKDPAARWASGAVLAAAARRATVPAQARRRIRLALPGRVPRAFGRLGRPIASIAGAAALAVVVVATSVAILGHPGTEGRAADPGATVAGGGTVPAEVPGAGTPAAAGTTGPTATAGATRPAGPSGTAGPTHAAGTALPAMPSGLTATAVSATTIRLQWMDNSANESGFTVINGAMSRDVGADATTFDWDGLAPGTSTCFKVRSFNSAGVSAFDPAAQPGICATSLSAAGPAAPSALLATPDNPNTIRLTWTDNSSNESGFTITTAGGVSQTVGANTTTFFWGGLAPGTTVCFRIRSFNSAGVSAYDPATQQAPVCATTPNTA